jgi:Exonuclease VII small subunit.
MPDRKSKISFEEALAGLEKSTETLKKDGTTLEAAMKSFEEGIDYYNYCNEILSNAKQRIEFFEKKDS